MSYSRTNPFLAKIKQRYPLTREGSLKETQHVIIDLADSGMLYQVGDSVGIFPENHPEVIKKTLQILNADPETPVILKKTEETLPLNQFLKTRANLRTVSKKLLDLAGCSHLTKEELEHYEVWDFIEENLPQIPTPQEFSELLMPMLPRFYSIASSQKMYPNEIHLTVAPVHYHTRGHLRYGVATDFLCHQAQIEQTTFGIYIQPHHGFTVPESGETDMIMIGPGTGIAPYRAFMQERLIQKSQAHHWLFFGEWNRATDFFYEEEWKTLASQMNLRVDCAFSRDQSEKVYVQHLLKKHSKEIFEMLENGAILYVCGDADQMAKDVDAALHEIALENLGGDSNAAKDYVKKLRTDKRYLRDVY